MDCRATLSMNRLFLLAVGCGLLVGRTSVRHGRLKSTLRLHGRLKQTPGSRDVCGIGRIRAARNDKKVASSLGLSASYLVSLLSSLARNKAPRLVVPAF